MYAQKKANSDAARHAFASLTAGLLARKGEAHPAPAHLDGVSLHSKSAEEYESVADTPAVVSAKKPVLAKDGCCNWALPEKAMEPLPPGQRHSMGLRLDDERLRRVKILAARAGASNQKVMLAALDHYLGHMSQTLAAECPCLARSMQTKA